MKDTYFISYPRCGRRWQETRMTVLLEECWEHISSQLTEEIRSKHSWSQRYEASVHNTHMGFEPMGSKEGVCRAPSFRKDSEVFVLVREAHNCINSHFFYIENKLRKRDPGFPAPRNRHKFLLSGWGAKRVCRFLNHIQRVRSQVSRLEILFYEDLFGEASVKRLPDILGIQYELSKEEIATIMKRADEPVNTYGTKKHLPRRLVKQIRNYLQKNCRLPEYRDRYL